MTEEEFKKEIYELAFGVGPYKPEPKEVVERIEKYTNDSFLVEDLEVKVNDAIKHLWGKKGEIDPDLSLGLRLRNNIENEENEKTLNAINTIIKALNQFHTSNNDNGETDTFKYY
ncbi:MAG: hypothetical protein CMJ76_00020 [Planctomycetaceae bacterium]|nr:hypothetical protein [Planctomycetaceae bacterium]|tara:strand:+ start:1335 stop:1679 length:345 start_codon:yes stop_codon:yes gene_type:complete